MACPFGDLGGWNSGIEPGRYGGVSEVVRSAGYKRRSFGPGECPRAGFVEHLQISAVADDLPGGEGEDAPAGAGAELGEVVAQKLNQFRMDRDGAEGLFINAI